jgi:hypothetical protein
MKEKLMPHRSDSLFRRNFLRDATFAAGASWLSLSLTSKLSAQQINDAAEMRASGTSAKISIEKLRRGVSVLIGSGGNIAVLPGHEGKSWSIPDSLRPGGKSAQPWIASATTRSATLSIHTGISITRTATSG